MSAHKVAAPIQAAGSELLYIPWLIVLLVPLSSYYCRAALLLAPNKTFEDPGVHIIPSGSRSNPHTAYVITTGANVNLSRDNKCKPAVGAQHECAGIGLTARLGFVHITMLSDSSGRPASEQLKPLAEYVLSTYFETEVHDPTLHNSYSAITPHNLPYGVATVVSVLASCGVCGTPRPCCPTCCTVQVGRRSILFPLAFRAHAGIQRSHL